jgi:hypothetical protein
MENKDGGYVNGVVGRDSGMSKRLPASLEVLAGVPNPK